MKLLVGLGNPGPKYAYNRHNVGFMAVDAIARAHGFGPWRGRFHGRIAEGTLAGEPVLLLKPMTFMNESGRAVGEMKRYFKLDLGDVAVLHDELDLAPGKVRVKRGGGHAGHNGLRSIDAHVGPDFRRVRIGIGHPGAREKVTGYVLRDFAKADKTWLEPLLDAIADAAPALATGDDARFMTRVAQAMQDASTAAARPDAATSEARRAAPKGKPKGKAKAAAAQAAARPKGAGPSQRDLARAAASRRRDRPASDPSPAPASSARAEQADGPLASLLKRWLGRASR